MHMQIACIHVAHRKLGKRRNVYLNAYFTQYVHVLSVNESQLCKYCFGAGTYILRITYGSVCRTKKINFLFFSSSVSAYNQKIKLKSGLPCTSKT